MLVDNYFYRFPASLLGSLDAVLAAYSFTPEPFGPSPLASNSAVETTEPILTVGGPAINNSISIM